MTRGKCVACRAGLIWMISGRTQAGCSNRHEGRSEIVAVGKFNHAFKESVIDFHHEKFALRRAAAVGTLAADAQTISFDRQLQIFSAHAGQFDFDDEAPAPSRPHRELQPVQTSPTKSAR